MNRVIVKDFMISKVHTIRPDDKIALARLKMLRYGVGALPVIDEDRTLRGIITLRDISFTGTMGDIMTLPVQDLMTRHNIITATETTTITEIADIMDRTGIQRIPIIDKDRKLVGIMTQSALLRAFRSQFQ